MFSFTQITCMSGKWDNSNWANILKSSELKFWLLLLFYWIVALFASIWKYSFGEEYSNACKIDDIKEKSFEKCFQRNLFNNNEMVVGLLVMIAY